MSTQTLREGDRIKFQLGQGQWSISHGTYLYPLEDVKGGTSEMSMIKTAVNRRMKIRTSNIWLHLEPEGERA